VVATKLRAGRAELYEADFHVWALQQAEKLRAHRLDELDVANLAEEIEGLAIALRSAVRSRTRTIIEHLLEHSPAAEPRHGWRRTLRIQRKELADDLSASLRAQLSDDLEQLYADGRENATDDLRAHGEHGAAAALPASCPYTLEQIASDWQPQEPQAPASA
jgi:hypothetical protein